MKKNRRGCLPPPSRTARPPGDQRPPATAEATPLTDVSVGLRELRRLLDEASTKFREMERCQRAILGSSTAAWTEREELIHRYYKMLRAVLRVRDDCRQAEEDGTSVIRAGLDRVLEEQRVEVLSVREGDTFDPELHQCESSQGVTGSSRGVVVRILAPGFVQRNKDGSRGVVRPALVQIGEDERAGGESR